MCVQFTDGDQSKHSTQTDDYDSDDELSLNIKDINSYCSCKSGAHVIATLYWFYDDLNGITMPRYNVKSTALEQNITNLHPCNRG